jgi:hypothetical protein
MPQLRSDCVRRNCLGRAAGRRGIPHRISRSAVPGTVPTALALAARGKGASPIVARGELTTRKVGIAFGRVSQSLHADMQRHGVAVTLGEEHIFSTLREALEAARGDDAMVSLPGKSGHQLRAVRIWATLMVS